MTRRGTVVFTVGGWLFGLSWSLLTTGSFAWALLGSAVAGLLVGLICLSWELPEYPT